MINKKNFISLVVFFKSFSVVVVVVFVVSTIITSTTKITIKPVKYYSKINLNREREKEREKAKLKRIKKARLCRMALRNSKLVMVGAEIEKKFRAFSFLSY